jgi:hypothetical protein
MNTLSALRDFSCFVGHFWGGKGGEGHAARRKREITEKTAGECVENLAINR